MGGDGVEGDDDCERPPAVLVTDLDNRRHRDDDGEHRNREQTPDGQRQGGEGGEDRDQPRTRADVGRSRGEAGDRNRGGKQDVQRQRMDASRSDETATEVHELKVLLARRADLIHSSDDAAPFAA